MFEFANTRTDKIYCPRCQLAQPSRSWARAKRQAAEAVRMMNNLVQRSIKTNGINLNIAEQVFCNFIRLTVAPKLRATRAMSRAVFA
jgi:hypothetical protein